jgi:putative addiction module component (TIGR02574 family)
MNTSLLEQPRQLSVEDQLELLQGLWDDIAARDALPLPTEAQKHELDRRLAALETDPEAAVSWSDVKSAALSSKGR